MDKKDVEKMLRINAKAKNTNEMVILLNRNKIKKEDCLFVLTDELYDEKLCFKAIKDLLYNGLVDMKKGRPPKEPQMKKNVNPAPLTESEREELIRLRAENEYIKAVLKLMECND